MINPSISGWIDKFFIDLKSKNQIKIDEESYYNNLRSSGFLFGNLINNDSEDKLLIGEITKVAFLEALFGIYFLNQKTTENFVENCNLFFGLVNPHKSSILEKILPKNSDSSTLEKNIDNRIYLNENIISKNFSQIETNAFLFVDILAFQKFLTEGLIPENYQKKIEETIISVLTLSLKTKNNKSSNDDLMLKFFENSIRYSKLSQINVSNIDDLKLDFFTNELEKKYLIDLASLTFWSDRKMENSEIYFLYKLSEKLDLKDTFVYESIAQTDDFITKNILQIPYFNNSNPFKNFYSQTTNKVSTLIIRNKKRLIKELVQSKELMRLLALSTQRDLDEAEKKKVRNQLLDICKTVPSLTIFLIPGGSLLLPILIKFIPQLLPSAFNENLEEEK